VRLIECVPNFSEGRDSAVIRQITDAIEAVERVRLLNVDPGRATNRTVVTFVGEPEAVVEGAVAGVRAASELIDMRRHHGEHPRFGATDVCPLVPVAGVTMEETVAYARELARRLGEELGVTVFCYENAATRPERRNLAAVRAGEYEGLADKLARPEWRPDFGPAEFNPRLGATAVGARDFLVAYNVNLNTTSVRRANAIAFDVRERGRVERRGDPLTGEVVRDADGEPVYLPGTLKAVKAIGWFIEEYGIAQISMNLTNIRTTPIHVAFEEVCRRAEERGLRVTGSELVGMVPLAALLDAGRHFLRKQQRSLGIPDEEVVRIAVKSLGLAELAPFKPEEKVIEVAIADPSRGRLVGQTVTGFVHATASESPAPGGGSVAAAVGALGAALGTMVANLSAHRRGWDERWEEFSDWAVKGKEAHEALLALVDEDTRAFNAVLAAHRMPAGTPAEKAAKQAALAAANRRAIEVPLQVMELSLGALVVARAMAATGQPSSISDAGVGALCCRTAADGAELNVRINVPGLGDRAAGGEYLRRAAALREQAHRLAAEVLSLVEQELAGG
jgi:glutamate formiminotransferase